MHSRISFDAVAETYRLLFAMGRNTHPAAVALPDLGMVTDATSWKIAHMIDPYTGRFSGISHGSFGMDSSSSCLKHAHSSPHPGCRCGFHAFHQRHDAVELGRSRWGAVLLTVELFGDIVRHRSGSRSAEQVVTGIELGARCGKTFCSSPTVGCAPAGGFWVASCKDHLADGLSLRDVSDLLGVPVGTTPQLH